MDPKEFSIRTDTTIAIEDLDFDPEDDLQEDLYNVDALPLELLGGAWKLQQQQKGSCYVCGKPDCWSTNYTPEERKASFDKFRAS
ncbi:hypothetical protein EG328_000349 [Venturia inaequalis]|uniref:Uncharacterized protein n=1 Tax=Venturia inaequalis TaxID=5025 RepID=A0A8H3U3E9_VENIN|nr:hypothetical protein EG328_000349 [Venturia inaequalis]